MRASPSDAIAPTNPAVIARFCGLSWTRAARESNERRKLSATDNEPSRTLIMCRNIRLLFNFAPPVTDDEIRAASLQFVRKISGFNKPSKSNEAAFLQAVD